MEDWLEVFKSGFNCDWPGLTTSFCIRQFTYIFSFLFREGTLFFAFFLQIFEEIQKF